MTDSYTATPGTVLDDLVRDIVVAGYLAKDRKLTPDYADRLAVRVKAAATAMLEPGDAQLLTKTADTLSRASLRIKSASSSRQRSKAATRPPSEPDFLAMSHQQDLERMFSGGLFDRNSFDDVERARSDAANRVLAERQRKLEESRARQIEEGHARDGLTEEERARPWWRR